MQEAHQKLRISVVCRSEEGWRPRDAYGVMTLVSTAPALAPRTIAAIATGRFGDPPSRANPLAAEVVVQTLLEMLAQPAGDDSVALLAEAVAAARARLVATTRAWPDIDAMLAVCAAVMIVSGRLYIVSVGNCRIYLMREGQLARLTTDHTFVQRLLDLGVVTRAELVNARPTSGSCLLRALCSEEEVDATPDFRLRLAETDTDEQARARQGLPLLPGDRILLCTDGVHGSLCTIEHFTDVDIERVLRANPDPETAAAELLRASQSLSGADWSRTVVLITVTADLHARAGDTRAPARGG